MSKIIISFSIFVLLLGILFYFICPFDPFALDENIILKETIKEYIPPELVDSLMYYSDKLRQALIVGLSLCGKNFNENMDSTKGSVSFIINYEEKYKMNSNYYLAHVIIQNIKFKENKTLHSIYDFGLTKDTVLLDELRYTISITPYSGF